MQEHPQGFGKDDLVFENGALDFIHHLHRKGRRAGNGARQPKGERFSSFARWSWCARSVARRVLCAAPDAALRVPSAVPDAVPRAPLAVPDAARCRTSPYLQAAAWARWAWWWLGLQPPSPSKARMKQPLQMQPRIQEKRVRCDDRPVSAPNVRSFSGSRFAAPVRACHPTSRAYLLIWINFAGRFKPRWNFRRRNCPSRQVRDDGSRRDDQSTSEFGSRKILGFCLCCERFG
jgi:hypothetical protein